MACPTRLRAFFAWLFVLGTLGGLAYLAYLLHGLGASSATLVLLAVLAVLAPLVLPLWPLRIDVSSGRIVVRTPFGRKVVEGFRVLGAFSQGELGRFVRWRIYGVWAAPWHGYGLFSTRFGRAWLYSSAACGGQWLAVEAGGRRYVVCCEEKDQDACRALGAPPATPGAACRKADAGMALMALATLSILGTAAFLVASMPKAVDVTPGAITMWKGLGKTVVVNFTVVGIADSLEVYGNCFGLRGSLYRSFDAECDTPYGRARIFSTPQCSGLWLIVEADGKRYAVCCEGKDRQLCQGLSRRGG